MSPVSAPTAVLGPSPTPVTISAPTVVPLPAPTAVLVPAPTPLPTAAFAVLNIIVVVIVVVVSLLVAAIFYYAYYKQKCKNIKVTPTPTPPEPKETKPDETQPANIQVNEDTPSQSIGKAVTGDDHGNRIKTFELLAIGDAEPWSLGSTELVGWLKEELERMDPKRDWTALLGALSGLDGVGLLDRCEKMSNPPWVKLKAGYDGTALIKLGIKSGQMGVLNKLLDRYGIGYY